MIRTVFIGHEDLPSFDNHSTRIIITFWGSNLTTSNYCGLLWGSLQYTWILNAVTGRRNRTAGLHTENHTKFLPSWYRRHIGACLSINQYKVFRKSYEISAYLEKRHICACHYITQYKVFRKYRCKLRPTGLWSQNRPGIIILSTQKIWYLDWRSWGATCCLVFSWSLL